MKVFAIELSSRHGSIALIEDGRIAARKSWVEDFKNRQQLFDAIGEMDVDWNSVDVFAVGRGPGAFSGMRIAFSVANALAAPAGKPIYAINSGAALALQAGVARLAVVGDARRNKVWAGIYSGTTLETEYRLMEREELAGFIPADTTVVSPDHDRLEELLAGYTTLPNAGPLFPAAENLGLLVFERLKNGVDSEPLEPLYMHPPVFIEPRFPA